MEKLMPMKENFYYLHPGFKEACRAMHGLMEKHQVWSGDGWDEGKAWHRNLIVFSERKARQAEKELRVDRFK